VRARRIALALFVVSAGAAAGRLLAGEPDEVFGRSWRDGPVRYLLTRDEYARFGKLKTQEARRAFAERFWRRWDPDPTTPVNEFRERFEERVAEANRRFAWPPIEGWRTDRGRVFILMGEPDEIRRLGGGPGALEREVWVYDRLAGAAGGPLEITFYRGPDWSYRLSPAREESLFDRDRRTPRPFRYTSRPLMRNLYGADPIPAEVLEALRRSRPWPVEPPPPTFRRPSGHDEPPSDRPGPLRPSAWFFEAADGSVLALVSVEVDTVAADGLLDSATSPPGSDSLVALVEAEEKGEEEENSWKRPGPRIAVLRPVSEASTDSRLVFCGKVYLEPGASYQVRYLVAERDGGAFLVRTASIEVPLLGTGELAASSVVAAERFGPAASSASGNLFAIGSEEVVPRFGATYGRGEPLRIYLQVYGAALDGETGRPRLDLVFRFERRTAGGFRRHGVPLSVRGASGQSLGLALPVGDWPPGPYRVSVEIRDRVGGQRTTAEGSFSIAP
jgi:GWxTD domain-containing protein